VRRQKRLVRAGGSGVWWTLQESIGGGDPETWRSYKIGSDGLKGLELFSPASTIWLSQSSKYLTLQS